MLVTGKIDGKKFTLKTALQSTDDRKSIADLCAAIFCDYRVNEKVFSHHDLFQYGYWTVRLNVASDNVITLDELDKDGSRFISGVSFAVKCWKLHQGVCEQLKSQFVPPGPFNLAVVSAGVIEGVRPVQGVRYLSTGTMSGWWLSTDEYDGNIDSMKPVHIHHVTAVRDDILPYIALSHGFRFDLGDQDDVWFDTDVAKEPAV